ncbi:MAG: DUF975 family protein [Treponema sp.]|uniref:DUF975 family protein n=1 Tax=Treponema sp. TaxID=166 RepID=UPI00298D61FC|nr:DUF975 family protein [Treponema sp.]MBR5932764.1 DUF975 family protein [Treponema sp.]
MFNRIEFKRKARAQLKGKLPICIAVVCISQFFDIIVTMLKTKLQVNNYVSFAFSIFTFCVTAIFSFALSGFFLKLTQKEECPEFKDYTVGFTTPVTAILKKLLESFMIFLWSLLVIIPSIIILALTGAFSILNAAGIFSIDNLENLDKFENEEFLRNFLTENIESFLVFFSVLSIALIALLVVMVRKHISYSQMNRILVENPGMAVSRAMSISIEYTKKHIGDLFFLSISFLGWILLALIAGYAIAMPFKKILPSLYEYLKLCLPQLGFCFIIPYTKTAHAYAYLYMKQEALEHGKIKINTIIQ